LIEDLYGFLIVIRTTNPRPRHVPTGTVRSEPLPNRTIRPEPLLRSAPGPPRPILQSPEGVRISSLQRWWWEVSLKLPLVWDCF